MLALQRKLPSALRRSDMFLILTDILPLLQTVLIALRLSARSMTPARPAKPYGCNEKAARNA
jgi:hypothetical protein